VPHDAGFAHLEAGLPRHHQQLDVEGKA